MNEFLKTLKLHYKKRYQRCLSSSKYINARLKIFKKILRSNIKIKSKIKNYKIKNFIITKDFLQKNLTEKKTLNEIKILLKLYKKISYSLKLKKKNNLNMSKLTNLNVDFSTYIYLGNQIIGLKQLNELQKLNCIFKINDITLINFKKKKLELIPYIKKNIIFEMKTTLKYAKKFINYHK